MIEATLISEPRPDAFNRSNPSRARTARKGAGIDTRPFASRRLVKLDTNRSIELRTHSTHGRTGPFRDDTPRPRRGNAEPAVGSQTLPPIC